MASGRFKRSYKDVEYREPGEGYDGEEPTKGIYPAKLVAVEDHVSQSDNESTHWTFELTDEAEGKNGDSYAGWRGHVYTNDEGAAWKEQQILVALGLMKPQGTISTTYDAILKKAARKAVKVRVYRERYIPDDGEGEGEWRAKIGSVMGGDGAGPATKRRRGKAADIDDDDLDDDMVDDDEDLDDDDEDEKPPARSRRSRKAKPEPEPEEDDDVDEEIDADELAEELDGLSLAALKKRAREEYEIRIKRGMEKDDIIDAILDTLDEEGDDEEEPEEEPEPPKRRARSSTRKASSARRGRRGSSEEPPF